MIYNLKNPYECDNLDRFIKKMKESGSVVEVTKKLPPRSGQQNRYLHLIIGWFACEVGYSMEEVKVDYFKKACNRDLFLRDKVNKHGQAIHYLRSTRDLTTGEMTTAIERFRNYSSAVAGVYLPAPNEQEFLLHIQQEMERQKDFLW